MIELSDLPLINATLNSIACVLLFAGRSMIRRGRVQQHKTCMIAAFCVSILFLATYLTYRFLGEEKMFTGTGWIRPVYFVILISHVTLAASVPVLATWTLLLGLKGRFDKHRRLARIAWPIWVYVSITGVIVYVLLFRVYGPATVGQVGAGLPAGGSFDYTVPGSRGDVRRMGRLATERNPPCSSRSSARSLCSGWSTCWCFAT